MVAKEESSNLLSSQEVTIAMQEPYSLRNECEPNDTNMGERGQSESIPATVGPTHNRITFTLPDPFPHPPPTHTHTHTGNKSLFDGVNYHIMSVPCAI